jgi:hypothetical protein
MDELTPNDIMGTYGTVCGVHQIVNTATGTSDDLVCAPTHFYNHNRFKFRQCNVYDYAAAHLMSASRWYMELWLKVAEPRNVQCDFCLLHGSKGLVLGAG